MAYKFFSVPVPETDSVATEINQFLSTHRIVSVKSQWVVRGGGGQEEIPYNVFTIEYVAGVDRIEAAAPQRVDYRKELEPEQFVRYCKLREERKRISDELSIKAFEVFTNEQLAEIARMEMPTKESLGKIKGVGEMRIEKYAERILAAL